MEEKETTGPKNNDGEKRKEKFFVHLMKEILKGRTLYPELILDAIREIEEEDREAVILVLDFDIQMLPWENLPILRNHEVTMLPKKPIDGAHEIQSYCLGHTDDGGPPRWFCPVAYNRPLKDSHVHMYLPGRTDIRMKLEIAQDTELVEPLDEACRWRQTRGTATETLGAEKQLLVFLLVIHQ
ncbi:unnamed protein product [Lactuca saligna]|uniref:Uncharacterized protein n=1 Tax=Lactuca saligna TaxID=75948 RepID=A0AA36E6P8_LACSI|nr:unnamed protein product [Lactuca saligna]